jgi:predicted outer membrane repeat protein
MSSSHFTFNIACDGGAIFNDATSFGYLSIHDSSISQNTARIQGGGIYSNYTGSPARIGIDSSGITSNTASDAGGLFDSSDPASYLESNATVILGNNATATGGCHNIGDLPCT